MPRGITTLVYEASSNQLISILTLLLGLTVALVLWRIHLRRLKAQVISRSSPKLKIRRIREIPDNITKDELQRRLEECLPNSSFALHDRETDNMRLTFARSSSRFCMATMTSYKAPERFQYPVDTDFIGVTPLFESSNADVE